MRRFFEPLPNTYKAWRSYESCPWTTQAFLAARVALLPIRSILEEIDITEGRVVSLGCGYGLLEHIISREFQNLEVIGIEFDEARVDLANKTVAPGSRLSFLQSDASSSLSVTTTAQLCLAVDLVHHLTDVQQKNLVTNLHSTLPKNAKVVVKDIARTPRWMHSWNSAHDRLVSGEITNCREPNEMENLLSLAGFEVNSSERMRRFDPYPHYMVTALKI
jgi:cyclopropane fatty-acyl-phospholipid synthase-like methyltransferase